MSSLNKRSKLVRNRVHDHKRPSFSDRSRDSDKHPEAIFFRDKRRSKERRNPSHQTRDSANNSKSLSSRGTYRNASESTYRNPSEHTYRNTSDGTYRNPSDSTYRNTSESNYRNPSESTYRNISESTYRHTSDATYKSTSERAIRCSSESRSGNYDHSKGRNKLSTINSKKSSPRLGNRRIEENRNLIRERDDNEARYRNHRSPVLNRERFRCSRSLERRRRSSSIERKPTEVRPDVYPNQYPFESNHLNNYCKEEQANYQQENEWNRNQEYPNQIPVREEIFNETLVRTPLNTTAAIELPEFNLDDLKFSSREWLNILEEVAAKQSWTSDDIKFHFALKLSGSAKTFLTQKGIMQRTWPKIKEFFLKTYPSDMEYYDQLVDMISINQKENENVLKYFHNKLAGITACGIIGRKAVSCLIGGLRDLELKKTALDHNFATTEELYTFLSNISKTIQPIEEKPEKSSTCRSQNHSSEDCFSRLPKQEKYMLTTQQKISRIDLSPQFLVDIIVNDFPLRGYINFESDEVTISETTAKNINLEYIKLFNCKVRCFGNNFVNVKGGAQVFLRVQQASASMKVFVVSDAQQSIPVIVGQSFSTFPNIQYEFSENGIYFFNQERMINAGVKERSPGPPPAKYRRGGDATAYKSRYPDKIYGKLLRGTFFFIFHFVTNTILFLVFLKIIFISLDFPPIPLQQYFVSLRKNLNFNRYLRWIFFNM